MKIKISGRRGREELAYTLVEVCLGVALLGFMTVSIFSGMSMSTAQTRIAREDLRATQIMMERMEGIRLFDWNQLTNSTLCPATFTSSFYPPGSDSMLAGIPYYGTMVVTNVSLSPAPSYSTQLLAITVAVCWTNFGISHHRQMTTYQAQFGMQNYIFNN
jgi:type II secretory pathway pseudopilin PulG